MNAAFWQTIIDDYYRLPEGHQVLDLTADLLDFLGSSNPLYRDKFAHNILARWIILYGYLSDDDLIRITRHLIPQLQTGIGEAEGDRVFLRSYTALILSVIAYHDSRNQFLEATLVREMLQQACWYLISEKDHRAYVTGKGWANACGHTADWLKFIAYNPLLQDDDLERILTTVAARVIAPMQVPFCHDEEDRLAKVVMAVLARDMLTYYDLLDWLQQLNRWKKDRDPKAPFDPVYNAQFQNVKHFLHSLYMQMRLKPQLPGVVDEFEPYLLDLIKRYNL